MLETTVLTGNGTSYQFLLGNMKLVKSLYNIDVRKFLAISFRLQTNIFPPFAIASR